jgi:hypothetical protein
MATVEQAEWVVDKVDGNIPHTLDAPVDVSFMPTGGLGCWELWGLGVASTWVMIQFPAAPKSFRNTICLAVSKSQQLLFGGLWRASEDLLPSTF